MATGNRHRRLVRAAQDQRCERLASINTPGRVGEDVAPRIDKIKRADIDNAIRDSRRKQGDSRRRRRPQWAAHRLSAARYGEGYQLFVT